MGRRPKVQRNAEEKFAIVLEGLKTGNVSETCRKYEIHLRCSIAGKTKWRRAPWLRLGGGAQPRGLMKSRPSASSNWSGRWAAVICRSRY